MGRRLKNTVLVFLCLLTAALFGLNLIIALDSSRFMSVRKSLGMGDPDMPAGGEIIIPAKIGVTGPAGLHMAQGSEVYGAFSELAPVLSEALGSVDKIWSIDKKEFEENLGKQGVYFSFSFPVPFYMLSYWWSGETGFSSDSYADTVLLTMGSGETELTFYDSINNSFFRADTAAGFDRLADICGAVTSANAVFAVYADGSHMLAPWEPVRVDTVRYPTYVSVPVDFTGEDGISKELLSAFSINPFLAKEYKTAGGDIVYVEGYTALQLSKDGSVAYSSNTDQGIRLEMPEAADTRERAAYTVKTVRKLLSDIYQAASAKCLLSVSEIDIKGGDSFRISFERMAGGAFITEKDGYTASVKIENGVVTEITLRISGLTQAGEKNMLPQRLLQSLLTGEDLSLFVRHTEKDGVLTPGVYSVRGGVRHGLE